MYIQLWESRDYHTKTPSASTKWEYPGAPEVLYVLNKTGPLFCNQRYYLVITLGWRRKFRKPWVARETMGSGDLELHAKPGGLQAWTWMRFVRPRIECIRVKDRMIIKVISLAYRLICCISNAMCVCLRHYPRPNLACYAMRIPRIHLLTIDLLNRIVQMGEDPKACYFTRISEFLEVGWRHGQEAMRKRWDPEASNCKRNHEVWSGLRFARPWIAGFKSCL